MLNARSASALLPTSSWTFPADVRFPHLDVPPPLTELEARRKMSALAREEPARRAAGLLRWGRLLQPLLAERRQPPDGPLRVLHLVHAVPARGQPGHAAVLVRVPEPVCDLFEMDVANASVYDGASAPAEAVLMALRIARRDRVVLAGSVHPEYRAVVGDLRGRARHRPGDLRRSGSTDGQLHAPDRPST